MKFIFECAQKHCIQHVNIMFLSLLPRPLPRYLSLGFDFGLRAWEQGYLKDPQHTITNKLTAKLIVTSNISLPH